MNNTVSGPISSHVRDPNTPESDLQEKVWHIVIDGNGFEYEVLSQCPSTAIDDYMDGKAKLRRVAANLNTLLVTYDTSEKEKLTYELMHDAATKLGLEILKHEPGSYAEIDDSWWWVSPNNGVLQVFCSPEELTSININDDSYMLMMSDDLTLENIKDRCQAINEWLANPIIKYGNQLEMDLIVKTFGSNTSSTNAPKPRSR